MPAAQDVDVWKKAGVLATTAAIFFGAVGTFAGWRLRAEEDGGMKTRVNILEQSNALRGPQIERSTLDNAIQDQSIKDLKEATSELIKTLKETNSRLDRLSGQLEAGLPRQR
jgi:septal ring factor EnvC (AmiA/AmiB activator)